MTRQLWRTHQTAQVGTCAKNALKEYTPTKHVPKERQSWRVFGHPCVDMRVLRQRRFFARS